MSRVPHVLSIDWDYITGDCMGDTAHCGFCGLDDDNVRGCEGGVGENPHTQEEQVQNLDRVLALPVKSTAPLYVAECHASILYVLYRNRMRGCTLHNYDEHDDSVEADSVAWYHRPYELTCGSWGSFAARYDVDGENVGFRNVHRDQFKPADLVFICKSSPWTPASEDEAFWMFVEFFEERCSYLHFVGHRRRELRREWRAYKILRGLEVQEGHLRRA